MYYAIRNGSIIGITEDKGLFLKSVLKLNSEYREFSDLGSSKAYIYNYLGAESKIENERNAIATKYVENTVHCFISKRFVQELSKTIYGAMYYFNGWKHYSNFRQLHPNTKFLVEDILGELFKINDIVKKNIVIICNDAEFFNYFKEYISSILEEIKTKNIDEIVSSKNGYLKNLTANLLMNNITVYMTQEEPYNENLVLLDYLLKGIINESLTNLGSKQHVYMAYNKSNVLNTLTSLNKPLPLELEVTKDYIHRINTRYYKNKVSIGNLSKLLSKKSTETTEQNVNKEENKIIETKEIEQKETMFSKKDLDSLSIQEILADVSIELI